MPSLDLLFLPLLLASFRAEGCKGRPFGSRVKESILTLMKFRIAGYSFFDSGDVELLGRRKRSPYADVG